MLLTEIWQEITADRVREAVTEYANLVPQKLKELDTFRFETLPQTLKDRKNESKAFLEKDELLQLVEWKLKHGTFRPNLMKLVSSNSEDSIKTTTIEAFELCGRAEIRESLQAVTKLSGIGPATASLILSVYDPDNVPFFSDELFRYVNVEVTKNSRVQGWDRKIGYTKKEYILLHERIGQVRERLTGSGDEDGGSVTALQLEKAAWVLARSTSGKTGEHAPKINNNGTEEVAGKDEPEGNGRLRKRQKTTKE